MKQAIRVEALKQKIMQDTLLKISDQVDQLDLNRFRQICLDIAGYLLESGLLFRIALSRKLIQVKVRS